MDLDAVRRAAAAAKSESQREREFYRYYDPIRRLADRDPTFHDVSSPNAAPHQPVPGPDKTLTSFAQLAALRLHARRAMLFFFNVQCAYALAESTQTCSLQDEASAERHLWLGFAMIPRKQSICDRTVRLPQLAPGVPALSIINDLEDDEMSSSLPCVTGNPHARFYAGVPITTGRGISIGSFCVLDDKPRAGLSPDEELFLREMSTTIMSHLEALRGFSAHQRGVRMIDGLDRFVEDSSNQRTEREKQSRDGSARASRRLRRGPKAFRSHASRESARTTAESHRSSDTRAQAVGSSTFKYSSMGQSGTLSSSDVRPPESSTSRPPSIHSQHSMERKVSDELYDNIVPVNIRLTFERAAKLLCEAIEVDQITFLDASVGSFAGLVNSSEDASGSSALSATTDGTFSDDRISVSSHEKDTSKPCRVLGEASRETDGTMANSTFPKVSERFLATLLRHYPRGKNFTMDDLESTSSDDGLRSTQLLDVKTTLAKLAGDSSGDDGIAPTKQYHKRSKHRDLEHLKRLFPDAHSLAICPLWDHTRGKWFAACVLWTSSPLRLFSAELELGFVDAFCDVVMAEVHRAEVERSDKAKTDFISSISHELRSPLHGILGSAEMLREQTLDDFSESMVEQISSCGSNLLDIIDNLLDYSDINFNSKLRRKIRRTGSEDGQSSSSNTAVRQKATLMSSSDGVAIDQITEEAVDASVSSHYFSRKSDSLQRVVTILDIEKPPSTCRIAVGGWKRVCVNLVTNALKYTSSGQICVNLKVQPSDPPNTKRFNVILSVADSGKGMSQDFARNGLLQAFKQEDTNLEGTGLGMHLVARIVKAFGGHIEVQTDKTGGGTCITITVALDASTSSDEMNVASTHLSLALPEHIENLKVGLIRWEVSAPDSSVSYNRAQSLQLEALNNTCRREGFETTIINQSTINEPTQVNIITEMDLPHLLDHDHQDRLILDAVAESKPLIILCETVKSQLELKEALAQTLPDKVIGYLLQPAGPKRLRKALQSVLSSGEQSSNRWVSISRFITRTNSPAVPIVQPNSQDSHQVNSIGNDVALDASRASIARLNENDRQRQSPRSSPTQTQNRDITLLVVEDNKVNQRLLVMYAKKRNYKVITANNGKEALELYSRAFQPSPLGPALAAPGATAATVLKPDTILMDINMPVMNGFESMRAIRAFERRNGLPSTTIFALTGLGSADAQREAFTSGCDHFLTKPVHFAELTKLLEKGGLESGV